MQAQVGNYGLTIVEKSQWEKMKQGKWCNGDKELGELLNGCPQYFEKAIIAQNDKFIYLLNSWNYTNDALMKSFFHPLSTQQ
jgi:hypothetical protein